MTVDKLFCLSPNRFATVHKTISAEFTADPFRRFLRGCSELRFGY